MRALRERGRCDRRGRSPVRKRIPLNTNRNNNNNNNNRRRGRNNNRGQGGGGGNGGPQGNRIDSRARGNAPQLLEKYRKLAHDASLNDDRVQTEYYLQFADHYFRVLADSKSPKDENRTRRDGDRGQQFDEFDDEEDEFDDFSRRSQPQHQPRAEPQHAAPAASQGSSSASSAAVPLEGQRGIEGDDVDVAAEDNPFTREGARRPRGRTRGGRNRQDEGGANEGGESSAAASPDPAGIFDSGVLPPSIPRSGADYEPEADMGESETEAAPRPRARAAARPRRRAAKPAEDDTGEALEAVS